MVFFKCFISGESSKEQYTSQTENIPEEYTWGSFVEIELDSVLHFDSATVLVL